MIGVVKITGIKVVKSKAMKAKPFSTKAPRTKAMKAIGLTWLGVQEMVEHCINLLETEGETALDVVRGIMTLIRAVSERDYTTIFLQLNKTKADVMKIIEAIKTEFNL